MDEQILYPGGAIPPAFAAPGRAVPTHPKTPVRLVR